MGFMGFYDDFDEYKYQSKRSYGRGSLIFTSLISAIIGGLIALLLFPVVSPESDGTGYSSPSSGSGTPVTAQSPDGDTSMTPAQYQVTVNSAVTEAVAKVEGAVVGVINIGEVRDFFSNQSRTVERGTGSGVVFDKNNGKAFVVTNLHVIDGARTVEVSLPNGDRVPAKLVGSDEITDLAVLEIDDEGVDTVAEFGSSSSLRVGEPAIAIGNPLGLKFSRSVTQGIISSIERTVPMDLNGDGSPEWELDVIQTDAAINPGNSGGALINISGQVIGINSLKISQSGVEGLGFAIPSDDVVPIIRDLTKYGEVQRPYIGIQPVDLKQVPSQYWKDPLQVPDDVHEGVVVYEVVRFGPADKAGLKKYDVIVKLDDQEVGSSAALRKYMYNYKEDGDKVRVTLYREGKLQTVDVTLGKMESDR